MTEEELLDLTRINVLAAANDHVLDPAHDVAVSVRIDRREIPGVHPACRIDRLGRPLGLVPVAVHD